MYSAAACFATRLTLNGVNLFTDKYISPSDLLLLVLAVYAIAYRERYAVGRTLQAFVNAEELRATENLSFTGFLKYFVV